MLFGSYSIRFRKPETPPSPTKFRVCYRVFAIADTSPEWRLAHVTSWQLWSQVECVHSSEVLLQVMLEQESPAALPTHVGPQTRVDERMLAHVASAAERLAAGAAGIGAIHRWLLRPLKLDGEA